MLKDIKEKPSFLYKYWKENIAKNNNQTDIYKRRIKMHNKLNLSIN